MTSVRPPVQRGSFRPRYPFGRMDALFDRLRSASLMVLRCAVVALLLLAVTGVCGCDGRAVRRHARAADVMHQALDMAADSIAITCGGEAVPEGDDEKARRCLAADTAHTSARVAWTGYAGAILLALEDDKPNLGRLLQLGLTLVVPYRDLVTALDFWGADLPDVPSLLGGDQ